MAELTYTGSVILHAIRSGRCYGFQIMETAALPSGTVYPALRKLERAGLIRARWERETIARAEQRPARRYYQVTRDGDTALFAAAEKYRLPEFAAEAIQG